MNDRILNPKQVSEILNIKVGTLFSHLSRKNDLPPFFRIGCQTRWLESDILKWINEKKKENLRKNFQD